MPEYLKILLLMVMGFALLFLELFIPGGIVGICGAVAVGGGCYLIYANYGSLPGAASVIASLLFAGLFFYFFMKSSFGKRLVLVYQQDDGDEYRSSNEVFDDLLGARGEALTPLRPAGTADFDGRRVDVVTDGGFVVKGAPIRVITVDGNRVVVEEIVETDEKAS